MKYKVGDKVRVREDLKAGDLYYMADGSASDAFVGDMLQFRGKTVDIERITDFGKYQIAGSDFNWVDEMFESPDTNKIVITTDGKTTLARLYDGKRVVKSAEAKCAPSDTFDFATGAKLAFDRLMRPETLVKAQLEQTSSTRIGGASIEQKMLL